MAIEALEVLYVPSRDVKADVTFYRDILGGRVNFAIKEMGARVAEIDESVSNHDAFVHRGDSSAV